MQALLFDLDGTLTDPFLGITKSIQFALEKLGRPVPDRSKLRFCIGPPLQGGFSQLLDTKDKKQIDLAIELYRERFSETGLYENTVYTGIPECLSELRAAGFRLYVATSKPHVYANRILRHFGLLGNFTGVFGAELDGRNSDKGDLIGVLLDHEDLAAERTLMIGDRKHDLIGARANEVRSVGVSYGYGSEQELAAEQPLAIVDSPQNVPDVVRKIFK